MQQKIFWNTSQFILQLSRLPFTQHKRSANIPPIPPINQIRKFSIPRKKPPLQLFGQAAQLQEQHKLLTTSQIPHFPQQSIKFSQEH